MAGTNIYGPDEVNAVVVDIGGYLCRAGYAGEDLPRAVFPAAAGVAPAPAAAGRPGGARELFVGNSALTLKRPYVEVVPAVGEDHVIGDWDVAARMLDYAMRQRLGADPSEHAVLLADAADAPGAAREAAVEALFERCGARAACLARAPALAAFTFVKQTAVVVDAGYGGTTVSAVHEGVVIPKSVTRSALGGKLLSRCMQTVLERELQDKGSRLMARHMFKRVPIPDFAQYDTVVQANTDITESYNLWGIEQLAADAKEALCRVSDSAFKESDNTFNHPFQMYELPDGTELNIGPERFRVPEVLFNPGRLRDFGLASDPLVAGRSALSWPALVKAAIEACDPKLQGDLWNNILLVGGTSLVPGARGRLEKDLGLVAPQGLRPRVNAPMNPAEKRFTAWIGGSVLACLPSFQASWMSRQEYLDHGPGLIYRKSP